MCLGVLTIAQEAVAPVSHGTVELWLAILTGLLAIATFWLAIATRSMARSTKRVVEMDSTPSIVFEYFNFVFFAPGAAGSPIKGIRINLVFKNPGKVRIQYRMRELEVVFNSETAENPRFHSGNCYIHPGMSRIYNYPFFPLKVGVNPPDAANPAIHGICKFQLDYWSTENDKRASLTQEIDFVILGTDPLHVDYSNTVVEYKD